jgi:hypothetical protein
VALLLPQAVLCWLLVLHWGGDRQQLLALCCLHGSTRCYVCLCWMLWG